MVKIGTKTLEEVDRAKETPVVEAAAIVVMITETRQSQNMRLKDTMKDGPISKLLITKTGHRTTQYKKIADTLSVICVDKNFRGLDEAIWTGHDLVERDFIPTYPGIT